MSAAASIEVKGWCPGALRPMQSGDGLIVRVRPCCGAFSLEQARGLADLARRLGNGHIDLTRRANLQLRGLVEERLPELHDGARQARPARSRCRDRGRAQRHGRRRWPDWIPPSARRPADRARARRRPCRRRTAARLAGEVRPAGRWRRHRLHRRRTRRHRAAGGRRRDRAAASTRRPERNGWAPRRRMLPQRPLLRRPALSRCGGTGDAPPHAQPFGRRYRAGRRRP